MGTVQLTAWAVFLVFFLPRGPTWHRRGGLMNCLQAFMVQVDAWLAG